MYVDGEENTLVLTSLTPDTEYAVSVFSVIGEDSSEPLKGTETTCKLHKCLPPLCCLFYLLYFTSHKMRSLPPLQTIINTNLPLGLGITFVC